MYNKTVIIPKLTNMDFFFIAYHPFSQMHMDFHCNTQRKVPFFYKVPHVEENENFYNFFFH
jgi:hypothetical protein